MPVDWLVTDAAVPWCVVQENGHWLEAVVFCLDNSATTSISTSTSGDGNPVTTVVLAGGFLVKYFAYSSFIF